MAGKDFYEIIGVKRSASEKEIKQAYRRLARKHHPDVNPGDKSAEERFKEINNAFEVLSDPEKRKKYDQFGENWQHANQMSDAWPGTGARGGGNHRGARTGFGGFGAGVDLDDLVGGIFGGLGGGRSRPRRGKDVEQPTEITLEEASQGSTRVVQLQKEETCSVCRGAGNIGGAACATCRGLGVQVKTKRLEVKIPEGARDGSRVRVAGEGQTGFGGGHNGDLLLVISVRPHDRFERKEDDLHVDVSVPLVIAILGGEAQITTLRGGAIALKIPPETQNGQVIRLAGLGMPKIGSPTTKGDLYARVKVVLPTRLTEQQKRLVEELKAALAAASV